MNNLIVLYHKQTTVVIDADGMVNASLLAKQSGRSPTEYIMLADCQAAIAQATACTGRPMPSQWQDNRVRLRSKPEYLHALKAAGITRQVSGTPGSHIAAGPNVGGNGAHNYESGLWVHAALAVGLARWLECRGQDHKPSPLADFVEQALAGCGVVERGALDNAAPKNAADSFAGMVSAQTLANLRQMDQILMDGGVNFSERHQTLRARIEQQARMEG